MLGNRTMVSSTAQDMAISPDAADLAWRLTGARFIFTDHPLSNNGDTWSVEDLGVSGFDPLRQILAYGIGQIDPLIPPEIEMDERGQPELFAWSVTLTERGSAWLEAGCPLDIQPPVSGQSNRRRRSA